jgi:hypothetical protein
MLLIMIIIINNMNGVLVKKRIAVIACNNIGVGGVLEEDIKCLGEMEQGLPGCRGSLEGVVIG